MVERRSIVRHKTFIKGQIYFNNRLSSMDCIVRDLTDNGARLEFSESVALPEMFELYMPNKDEYFQARIEWRKGNNIGVSWTPEDPLNPHRDSGRNDHHLTDKVARLEREIALLHKRLDAVEQGLRR
jgi:hypothetical protein